MVGRCPEKLTALRTGKVSQLRGGTVSQGYPEAQEPRNGTALRGLLCRGIAAPRGRLPLRALEPKLLLLLLLSFLLLTRVTTGSKPLKDIYWRENPGGATQKEAGNWSDSL